MSDRSRSARAASDRAAFSFDSTSLQMAPYEAAYGNKKSPDCGHVYITSSSSESDQKFTVTATSDWVIDWEGAGQAGTIRLNGLVREAQIAIGEAQVLVQ